MEVYRPFDMKCSCGGSGRVYTGKGAWGGKWDTCPECVERLVRDSIKHADGIDAFDVQAAGIGRKLIDDALQARTNAQLSERSE